MAATAEALELDSFAPDALHDKTTANRAEDGNKLVFCFTDGTEIVKRWKDRFRAERWTSEMKAVTAQKTRERRKRSCQHQEQ